MTKGAVDHHFDGEAVRFGGRTFRVRDVGPGESADESTWLLDGSAEAAPGGPPGGQRVAFIGDVAYHRVHGWLQEGRVVRCPPLPTSPASSVPAEHLADAAYISAALLVRSAEAYGVALVGPPRPDPGWQRRAGGYAAGDFQIEWDRERAVCPQGHASTQWRRYASPRRADYVRARFAPADCRACPARAGCVRPPTGARQLLLHPPAQHAALAAARARQASPEGRRQ